MKNSIFIILFLISFFSSSYAFDNDVFCHKNLENKGIKKITEKKYTNGEAVYFFNREGYLSNEIHFTKKNEILSEWIYSYIVTDTLLEIKMIGTIGNNERKSTYRYYYTSLGQCYKRKVFFLDSDSSSHFLDNFVYEDGMLVSYTEGKKSATKFVYEYNEKRQKKQILKTSGEYSTFYTYMYNNTGQLTDFIHEVINNDNELVVLSGVVIYSRNNTNKSHIRYSNFDKHGNWTRSHFITEKGKVFRSKRKIEYW